MSVVLLEGSLLLMVRPGWVDNASFGEDKKEGIRVMRIRSARLTWPREEDRGGSMMTCIAHLLLNDSTPPSHQGNMVDT